MAVPPGSPLEWGRSFPAFTPGRLALGPLTAPREGRDAAPPDARETITTSDARRLDVRIGTASGLVRVLTWDLAAHLDWIRMRRNPAPVTGAPTRMPDRPAYGDGLYWVSLAPLLRLLLHPGVVSRAETVLHLTEIGPYVEDVLDAAAAEKALADAIALVRERIEPRDTSAAVPLQPGVDATVRARMLSRFVLEELLRHHPYDPEGRFGERLFLFAAELEGSLARYARHGHSFVRRNAVSALARYETRTAAASLLELAAGTDDPVVLVRALAGLGRAGAPLDWTPLIARLERAADPLERVALIGALGRAGARAAVPLLLRYGREALAAHDVDVLVTVLSALAELRDARSAPELAAFAAAVQTEAVERPRSFRLEGPPPLVLPDVPDPPERRATVLLHHALLLRQRCAPDDEGTREALSALLERSPPPSWAEDATARGMQRYVGSCLERVVPSARFLFVENLAFGDQGGRADLALVADDPRVEEALRGHALARLPADERSQRLAALLQRREADPVMRLQAFALLEREGDRRVVELGHALLRECAALEAGKGSPELRYLFLQTVRALDARGALRAEQLAPLLHHVRAPLNGAGDLIADLERLIAEAADLAAGGAGAQALREKLLVALERVRAAEVNPALDESTEDEVLKYVVGQLAGLRARPGDAEYRELVIGAVAEKLLGAPLSRPDRLRGEFLPTVPLEEEILLALGRTREPLAVEVLAQFLGPGKGSWRAHACLALAAAGQRSVAPRLAPLLLDEEPFVRFCAAEAVTSLTGATVEVDWMFGPSAERFAAAERLWAGLQEKR